MENHYEQSKLGGNEMIAVNPKVKCPRCGRYLVYLKGRIPGVAPSFKYWCSHCQTGFSELDPRLRGGVSVNPKAKCPKCGTFMSFVGKTRAWGNKYQCTRCGYKRFTKAVKPWQRVTESNPTQSKQLKILGIPVIPLVIIAGLVYWLSKRSA